MPCFFNLTAVALPHRLYDGLDVTAYIKPDWPVGGSTLGHPDMVAHHYYRVRLGVYETLQACHGQPRTHPAVGYRTSQTGRARDVPMQCAC